MPLPHHPSASASTVDATVYVPEEHQLGQYIPLHYHYNMLQDADRVGAFQAAIAQVVQPGMHVVELGAGTGLLSSFAARRGASVTCVERNPQLVATAKTLLQANGLAQLTSVVQADAGLFVPERPVDVVICEMLHVALLREKQLQIIDAFKRNYRRKFGNLVALPTFMPEASILMWQPVHQSFDFAGYWAPVPMFQPPVLVNERTTELGPLDPYASIAYESEFPLNFRCQQFLQASAEGLANAIRFVTQNVMAIDVPNQTAITWPNQCLVLPLTESLNVRCGQLLHISFDYTAGDKIESLAETVRLRVEV